MLCSVWSLHGWWLWYLELRHEPLYEYLGTSFLSSIFHQISHFSTKSSHINNLFAFATSELQQPQLQRRKWEHWDLWARQILWTWTTHFKWCIFFQFLYRHIVRLKVDKFDWNGNALLKHQFNLLTRVTKRSGSLANKSTWNLRSRSHYRTWSLRPK